MPMHVEHGENYEWELQVRTMVPNAGRFIGGFRSYSVAGFRGRLESGERIKQ